jgi:hypothetical protein
MKFPNYGEEMMINKNICIGLHGERCVYPKDKEGWVFEFCRQNIVGD